MVLGHTGRNFAAGMSGGLAFVLDEAGDFELRYNPEMVSLERLTDPEDADILRWLVQRHQDSTGSMKARQVLENWDRYLSLFWKVVPKPSEAKVAPPSTLSAVMSLIAAKVRN